MIVVHILLFILKLIGILLLVILGLILLMLLIVLFVPIRYKVSGETGEGYKVEAFKNGEVNVKVSWLANLLAFHFNLLQGQKHMWVRILFFKLKLGDDKEEDPKKAARKKAKKQKREQRRAKRKAKKEAKEAKKEDKHVREVAEIVEEVEPEPLLLEAEGVQPPAECVPPPKIECAPPKVEKECDSHTETAGRIGRIFIAIRRMRRSIFSTIRQVRRSIFAAIRRVWRGIFGTISKVRERIRTIRDRVRNIRQKVATVWAFLTDERNKEALRHIFRELKRFLFYLLPTEIMLDIVFSTGKPDMTGMVYGGLCINRLIYRPHVNILPDFESDVWFAKGDFFLKGRFRLVRVVRMGLILLLDKNVRNLWKNFKKMREELSSEPDYDDEALMDEKIESQGKSSRPIDKDESPDCSK